MARLHETELSALYYDMNMHRLVRLVHSELIATYLVCVNIWATLYNAHNTYSASSVPTDKVSK